MPLLPPPPTGQQAVPSSAALAYGPGGSLGARGAAAAPAAKPTQGSISKDNSRGVGAGTGVGVGMGGGSSNGHGQGGIVGTQPSAAPAASSADAVYGAKQPVGGPITRSSATAPAPAPAANKNKR